MTDIYRNPETKDYDVPISTEEWMEILQLPQITQNSNILFALEKWYRTPDYTSSCKALGQKYGLTHHFFSVQNICLGKIALKHLNRFRLVEETNGKVKAVYWLVAWVSLGTKNGTFIVKLRPELVKAITDLKLFEPDIDDTINKRLQNLNLNNETFEFSYEQYKKPTRSEKKYSDFSRSIQATKRALLHSKWKCEFNPSHETFPRKKDGFPYLETHHLIPMKHADNFEISIDIPENIVCLCSTCHNRIHFGQNNKEIIEYLWNLRKDDLQKLGINIELAELLNLYST